MVVMSHYGVDYLVVSNISRHCRLTVSVITRSGTFDGRSQAGPVRRVDIPSGVPIPQCAMYGEFFCFEGTYL